MSRQNPIDVQTGEVGLAEADGILRAPALGSCVAVALWDGVTRTGAMAHVMLPGRAPNEAASDAVRYAANAIDELFALLDASGASRRNLKVCLAGGGNVLRDPEDTICEANIRSVREGLEARGLQIQASSLGGFSRRSVSLDVASGRVLLSVGDGPERVMHSEEESF